MARKKRKPAGGRPKRQPRPQPPEPLDIPDPRLMEHMLRQLTGRLGGQVEDDSPLGRAQEIIYQAFEQDDPAERVRLAKEALQVSPDCADAYTLLAEQAGSRKEALALLEQALAAGERGLGPDIFREAAGDFWGILETRPYMRARLQLALALWEAGRRDEAVDELRDMLRLNPNDNQGIRYTLAGFLLALDRDDELEQLLNQYPEEGSASWAYTRALLAFRQHGDTPESRRLLKQALKANKHVPPYLLGEKFPPLEQPPYYGIGDENEALIYLASALSGWKSTPDAIAWLREVVEPKKKPVRAARIWEPSAAARKGLLRLPQEEDVWQCDCRQLPVWVDFNGERKRPWALLVTSRSSDLILAHQLTGEAASAKEVWESLAAAMRQPPACEPHRPTELQLRPGEIALTLRPHLEEIGITPVPTETLDQLDAVLEGLIHHLSEREPPGLLDVPGVTPEQVGQFFQAAAAFYRQAPWKKLGYENAIRVDCEHYEGGPWYAVLMGQSGLAQGMALYENLDLLRMLWSGQASDEENARETVATSLIFGDDTCMAASDLDAAERFGWEVARPDAYPMIFHKERGMSSRPPLAWELELMEGCLRAIPGFVDRHPQDDPTREEVTVPAAAGELRLALSWVMDDPSR